MFMLEDRVVVLVKFIEVMGLISRMMLVLRLMDWASQKGMGLMNTSFQRKIIHLVTHTSGHAEINIDYMC